MDNVDMKLKEGVVLSNKDVSDMAVALRSIGFYFYTICGDEEHPEALREALNGNRTVIPYCWVSIYAVAADPALST